MHCNVLEYLEAVVSRWPEKKAVADKDGALTFRELREQAISLASLLVGKLGTVNHPVAVFLPKSKESIVSFAGILYSGNCYVPLDEKSPSPRLRSVLDKLKPRAIITRKTDVDRLRDLGCDENILVVLEDAIVHGSPEANELAARRWQSLIDTDPVYIIHTSGSTGTPKGVIIAHRGVIDYIDWAKKCYCVDEHAVIGNQAPFHFDNSTLDIYLSFATGATLELIPEECFAFPAKLMEYLVNRSVNMVFWVPSVLINAANLKIFDKGVLPPLEKILFAGEIMPNKQLNYWRRHFPHALFSNLYGPTEITVDCTYYTVDRAFADDEPLPIGIPCRNTDVLILKEDNLLAGPGEHGELCVRGSSLALGYWNNPEKTAEVFTQNPLNPYYPEKIYRTGDIVFTNDRGEIIFVGRKDSQIKHMGYRIELGEIETAAKSLPDIANACVLYDRQKLEIILIYESPTEIAAENWRRTLLEKLPKYMLPRRFVWLNSMPLTPNGKIDRQKLVASYLA